MNSPGYLLARKVSQITGMFINCDVIYLKPSNAQRNAIFYLDFGNDPEKKNNNNKKLSPILQPNAY